MPIFYVQRRQKQAEEQSHRLLTHLTADAQNSDHMMWTPGAGGTHMNTAPSAHPSGRAYQMTGDGDSSHVCGGNDDVQD